MDRASDSGSEGWGFESLPVYHKSTLTLIELAWISFYVNTGIVPKRQKKRHFLGITLEGGAFLLYFIKIPVTTPCNEFSHRSTSYCTRVTSCEVFNESTK